jgi:hypothetical protein
MAFAAAVTDQTFYGNHRVVVGSYTNREADSGGAITTALDYIFEFNTTVTGQVGATVPKVTISGGTATLVTDNGVDGTWVARGK